MPGRPTPARQQPRFEEFAAYLSAFPSRPRYVTDMFERTKGAGAAGARSWSGEVVAMSGPVNRKAGREGGSRGEDADRRAPAAVSRSGDGWCLSPSAPSGLTGVRL